MLYRPYEPADFPQLYAIEELCFEPPLRFSRAYMLERLQNRHSATWIAELPAEENRQLTGFAIVEWESKSAAPAAYIQTIEVAPTQRHKGIANELLRRVEHSARTAGAQTIWLHVDTENAPAIHLYESHGYQLKGREEHYYARHHHAHIYCKSLTKESRGA